ncbi:MAG TPA: RsmB/NOP family class I SAM-dependent RNA methyltransferase [Burkholderiales bacterium]|nr:RsmB/NOP family class I SAM-dependent RNA methyltransferase [Burkholderiales bacterium]
MPHPSNFHDAAELLKIILEGTLPADAQMDRYFRARREMGVRDRGFVAETVYGCLREKRMLEYLTTPGTADDSMDAGSRASSGTNAEAKQRLEPLPSATDKPSLATARADRTSSSFDLVAAYLVTHGYSGRALEELGYRGDARQLAERVRGLDQATVPFAVRANLPDWLAERLLAQFSEAEALALVQALNQPATLDLRVNIFKAERAEVQARLIQEDVTVEPTPYSPIGLRRAERAALFSTQGFKDGLFEVQDEGSQLLSYLLEPKRNEMIVDFCAGAGGKTLHIGSLMANTGTVYAFDVSAKRLEKLTPRLRRAGLGNVRTVTIRHERDDRVRRLHGKINRVLVDAPCSGTGTLRRNPDIKWRTLNLPELVDTQKRILAAAAQLVKPGGRLVYATCSLLREENEDVIEDFVAAHADFHIVPANEILARRHIPLEMPGPALRLLTHRHHTDSFYAAVLDRSR